ncbi:uncharacterized protein LOC106158164 [Lingula anatina]|uniref:Uncharacterized protein LOC106158164 n=1 Tax=Lingula anatina TaxID=7574 RepID=A0A2R2MRH5_LINAN|nr:uncharacterized protein LOC106158164 [Lingula anatina]|eukprot:XP_023932851.1 uncharacterized protein LOC106158164 [Lingula anatina]
MHSKNHSRSCRKGNQTCRFNFPRPVSTRTFVCKPIKLDEEKPKHIIRKAAREALEKLATITSDEKNISLTAQQCLELAGMTQEGLEYSMGILARKTIIVLKREPKECWVNQYNPHLLEAWDANIDIQYIVDAYACICYIVSYISKKESEEGELLKAAQKEAREGNTEAVNELKTLGKVYITHREISVMEAIYRCTGMKLKSSSREVRWIAADKDATRLSLPLNILKQQAREKRLDQIWAKSDLERYWNRPDNRKFENMSLAHFVANYRMYGSKVGKKSKENSGSDNDDSDNEGKEDIALLNNFGYISARRRPIVIRYLKGSVDRDPERYYENRLRLFFPHRGQDILPSAFTSYETFHNNASFVFNDDDIPICEIVNTNSAPFEKDAEVIDTALQRSYDDHEDAWADIAPGAEEQRIDDKMEQVLPIESDDKTEEVQLPDLDQTLPDKNPYPKTNLLTENLKSQISLKQAEKMVQSMNIQQLQIFNYMPHFKDLTSNPEMAVADIVGITESWLNSKVPSGKYSIPGFQLIRCDRQNDTSRGGVAVYIRNNLKVTEVKNNSVTEPGFECMDEVLNKVNTNKSALQNTKEAISFADTHTEETTSKIADLEKRIDFLGSEREINTERTATLERRMAQLEREFRREKEDKKLLKWEKEAMVNRVTGLMLTISRQHDEIDRLNGLLEAKPPDDAMTELSKPYEEVGPIVIKITGDADTPGGGDKNDTKAAQDDEKAESARLKRLEVEIDQIREKLGQMEEEGYAAKDHSVAPKTDTLDFLMKEEVCK